VESDFSAHFQHWLPVHQEPLAFQLVTLSAAAAKQNFSDVHQTQK